MKECSLFIYIKCIWDICHMCAKSNCVIMLCWIYMHNDSNGLMSRKSLCMHTSNRSMLVVMYTIIAVVIEFTWTQESSNMCNPFVSMHTYMSHYIVVFVYVHIFSYVVNHNLWHVLCHDAIYAWSDEFDVIIIVKLTSVDDIKMNMKSWNDQLLFISFVMCNAWVMWFKRKKFALYQNYN